MHSVVKTDRHNSRNEFFDASFPTHCWSSGGHVVRSRLWGRRVPGSKPDSTEDQPCIGPGAHQIIRRRSDVLTEEGAPAQVSSERGSKLRGPSENSHRVSSKQDVNMTKLQTFLTLARTMVPECPQ
ncbi:hypothetical protein AVEN_208762-1 [Araneus ventricosus]|uniref:Uncharacterized protein n=1 Tax=Araneus ventricosus TaxID=182803 RepID=A0A4Y2GMC8_ARAVE|nr:hypothetical protein AVEN_2097-1 [Araneus ventricosus]GBM54337.1 hypothetical protein AVEN_61751-1 [Araneus ventricosus]GBM54353.1 hypothetical protein AVEN_64416-1 [Araneus ventricosus]GBM54506.1 hypothetical protein AVEN_208762-1 [Araneus ventricosus]